MSKLPNAPLVEVIFELRWDSTNRANLDKFQLILGSMFSELKVDFPNVTNLVPTAIPINALVGMPTHRFSNDNRYPMYQLGPGILSINTVDKVYAWETFIETINKVVDVFKKLSELNGQKIVLTLKYVDFFKCNFSEIDLTEYIKDKFHLSVSAPFLEDSKAKTFSFATTRDVESGVFTMTMNTGYNNADGTQVEGIIAESNISKEILFENLERYIASELPKAHTYLGDFFKKMTEGELYESFV